MIKGGYILQPRIIQESDISVAPPYVREIWNYLLREANARDNKYNGHEIKRGQLFRSYEDIREGTKWFIGWRKMSYNENQTKKAMKFLRDTGRITTTKELGGVLITICKYSYYQDPKNYDRTTEGTEERTIEEPSKNQPLPDNNKNDKNNKNEKKKKATAILFNESNVSDFKSFCTELSTYSNGKYKTADMNYYYESVKNWALSKNEMKADWVATSAGFMLRDIRDKKFKRAEQ